MGIKHWNARLLIAALLILISPVPLAFSMKQRGAQPWPAPEVPYGTAGESLTFTVDRLQVASQTGHTCGIHAAKNALAYLANPGDPRVMMDIAQLQNIQRRHEIPAESLSESEIRTLLEKAFNEPEYASQASTWRKQLLIIPCLDDQQRLSKGIHEAALSLHPYDDYVIEFVKALARGKPVALIIGTPQQREYGHWICVGAQQQEDVITLTVLDSLNSLSPAAYASLLNEVCNFFRYLTPDTAEAALAVTQDPSLAQLYTAALNKGPNNLYTEFCDSFLNEDLRPAYQGLSTQSIRWLIQLAASHHGMRSTEPGAAFLTPANLAAAKEDILLQLKPSGGLPEEQAPLSRQRPTHQKNRRCSLCSWFWALLGKGSKED